ncbi:MAG: cobalamin-dependent protein [Gammaproteobacteria bacterium]|jgi:radical SAM superfamily enzyme YgiQ (UPF0313 family)
MRVLLVSANRERIPDPIFPLGLAYVAAATRQAGHVVEVADLCFDRAPLRTLGSRVRRFRPDLVGLSLRNVDNAAYPRTVDYLEQHRAVVDVLHDTTTAPVVLGGSGFSIMPGAYMQALDGDWGIAGEAESAFTGLLEALEDGRTPADITGLYGRDGCPTFAPATAPSPARQPGWQEGLRPARELLDYPRYIRRGGMGNVQTKRGCVFKCSYCTYPLLEGRRFRARAAGDVVDEIVALLRNYGPHPIFFVDSILNFPRGHVESLCEEILRRGVKLRWSCYATPLKLDRHQARLMAAAGCEGIELGSDAVDDGQLGRLGKSFDAETVYRANRYCLQAGMRVCQTLIFGAPGETRASIRATCTALRRMQPTAVVAMTGVRLYPGTPLTDSLIRQGRVPANAVGLLPAFYVEPEIADFLPVYLQQQAYEAGNWVLPGLAAPILPGSQRLLRGLGISGPLWRLLQNRWMHAVNRTRFRHPGTSWGVPHPRRKIV